jgi:hypothetical protein
MHKNCPVPARKATADPSTRLAADCAANFAQDDSFVGGVDLGADPIHLNVNQMQGASS